MTVLNFTDEEVTLLRDMAREFKQNRRGTPIRNRGLRQGSFSDEGLSGPEVWVVKPQSSTGIPAYGSAGSGLAGEATCDLYRIFRDASDGPEVAQLATGDEETVLNLAGALPQVFLLATRTSGGFLVANVVGYKYVRFTLTQAMTTAQASRTATITDEYGVGHDAPSSSIVVYNLETSSSGVYLFEGDIGDAGYALWFNKSEYRIIQMECP